MEREKLVRGVISKKSVSNQTGQAMLGMMASVSVVLLIIYCLDASNKTLIVSSVP